MNQPPRNQRFLLSLLLVCAGLPSLGEEAARHQAHERIREAAERHILNDPQPAEGRLELEVGHLDSRLRLNACDHPLETFTPDGSGTGSRATVGVRCHTPTPWTLYVPVTRALYQPVLVTSQSLARGRRLKSGDLHLEERDTTRLHRGYLTDPRQALGNTLKRSLRMESVLLPTHIKAPYAIKRGERVSIIAKSGELYVRMQGKALESGALNDRIQVRNESSDRKIEALVTARGVVEVTL